MKLSRLFLTLSLWCLNSATLAKIADDSHEMKVIITSRIEVPAHRAVVLDDLAVLDGVSPDQGEALGETVIFPALKAADTNTYAGAEVARLVKEKLSLPAGAALRTIVPEVVEIRAIPGALNPAVVERQIHRAAARWCAECRLTVHDLKLPNGALAAEGKTWDVDYGRVTRGGSLLIPVKAGNEAFWITGALKVEREGYVLQRAIPAGGSIPTDGAEARWLDITFAKDALATRDEIATQITQRALAMGSPILKSDLKRVFAVKKGQIVRAVSGTDVLEVSRQLVAEDNGYVGEVIRLKNPENQKIVSGKVMDEQSARVE